MNKRYEFKPDYKVHPGETLKEFLEAKELSINEAAFLANIEFTKIKGIIIGNAPITDKIATRLEEVFGISRVILINMNEAYYNDEKN